MTFTRSIWYWNSSSFGGKYQYVYSLNHNFVQNSPELALSQKWANPPKRRQQIAFLTSLMQSFLPAKMDLLHSNPRWFSREQYRMRSLSFAAACWRTLCRYGFCVWFCWWDGQPGPPGGDVFALFPFGASPKTPMWKAQLYRVSMYWVYSKS